MTVLKVSRTHPTLIHHNLNQNGWDDKGPRKEGLSLFVLLLLSSPLFSYPPIPSCLSPALPCPPPSHPKRGCHIDTCATTGHKTLVQKETLEITLIKTLLNP